MKANPNTAGVCFHGGEHVLDSFAFLAPAFKAALEQLGPVDVLPEYFHHLDPQQRRAGFDRFIRRIDRLFLWMPRSPRLLRELLEARSRADHQVRACYLSLGEMPLGGGWLRACIELLRPGDRVLFTCSADRRIFDNLFESCVAAIDLFPFYVDTARFRRLDAGERARTRADLGYGDTDVVFMYGGRVTPEKNVHALLQLFARVVRDDPRARLLIAGPIQGIPFFSRSTEAPDLGRLYVGLLRDDSRLRSAVRFIPERLRPDSMVSLYAAADVFLNLTLHHSENFGLANVEAMCCGLPVIGSDWGGLRDTIVHGKTGFRIPTYATGAREYVHLPEAARRCLQLVHDASLRHAMGLAAEQHARLRYPVTALPGRLAEVLQPAVGTGDGESRLTEFGARFHAEFFDDAALDYPLPRYRPEHDALYRQLIAPYHTASMPSSSDMHTELFLSTPFIEHDGEELVLVDATWPGELRVRGSACAVVHALRGCVFTSPAELIDVAGGGTTGTRVIEQLMTQGVLVSGPRTVSLAAQGLEAA